jgi:hypothetical protein
MPLLDHFRPPLYPLRRWESFHGQWAASLAGQLNHVLPSPRYFSQIQRHLGTQIEADVAEFENRLYEPFAGNGSSGGSAVLTESLPATVGAMNAVFPDDLEVEIVDADYARLVAVIELVSPANKDRPETRRAFAAKCAAYLQRGIGLMVLDIVTIRQFNLHDEFVELLGQSESPRMTESPSTYAISYRPVRRDDDNLIDLWWEPLSIGRPLPSLPLGLRGAGCVIVDLDRAYAEARDREGLRGS